MSRLKTAIKVMGAKKRARKATKQARKTKQDLYNNLVDKSNATNRRELKIAKDIASKGLKGNRRIKDILGDMKGVKYMAQKPYKKKS